MEYFGGAKIQQFFELGKFSSWEIVGPLYRRHFLLIARQIVRQAHRWRSEYATHIPPAWRFDRKARW